MDAQRLGFGRLDIQRLGVVDQRDLAAGRDQVDDCGPMLIRGRQRGDIAWGLAQLCQLRG